MNSFRQDRRWWERLQDGDITMTTLSKLSSNAPPIESIRKGGTWSIMVAGFMTCTRQMHKGFRRKKKLIKRLRNELKEKQATIDMLELANHALKTGKKLGDGR